MKNKEKEDSELNLMITKMMEEERMKREQLERRYIESMTNAGWSLVEKDDDLKTRKEGQELEIDEETREYIRQNKAAYRQMLKETRAL